MNKIKKSINQTKIINILVTLFNNLCNIYFEKLLLIYVL